MSKLKVLALEADKSQAASVRRIVHHLPGVQLTIVASKEALIDKLDGALPDVLLLPSLLSPSAEAQLLERARSLEHGSHLEVLFTPFLFSGDWNLTPDEAPAWKRWLSSPARPARPRANACDPRAFGEQLRWSLLRAQERRAELAERRRVELELEESLKDRRFHQRFRAEELRWLRQVRFKNGPEVKLIDVSAGGVLLETATRLPARAETAVHLIGHNHELVLPIRVIRSSPASGGAAGFWDGCALTEPLDIDKLLKPNAVDLGVLHGLKPPTINPYSVFECAEHSDSVVRGPADVRQREERLPASDAPWASNVRMPWGLEVDLLNISRTGMLVETTTKLLPGSEAEIQISGPRTNVAVTARFVRSEVAGVTAHGVTYRAAAAFETELKFPECAKASAPRALADLLSHVLSTQRGSDRTILRRRFSQELRKLVSAREITISESPVDHGSGGESIYFKVPSAGSPVVLQATFEPDHELGQAEFKFLQAAAALVAVVIECERMPAT